MPSQKDLDRFRGEIGESIIAYELMKRGWHVLKNLGGHGYDLVAHSNNNLVTRRIEVKTTDPALKTGKSKNQLTVLLTKAEYQTADFLIFYIHGYETYFIVPRAAYPGSRSLTVSLGQNGTVNKGSAYEACRNKWDGLN